MRLVHAYILPTLKYTKSVYIPVNATLSTVNYEAIGWKANYRAFSLRPRQDACEINKLSVTVKAVAVC